MKIKNSMMYKSIFCLKGGLVFSFSPVADTIELLCKQPSIFK